MIRIAAPTIGADVVERQPGGNPADETFVHETMSEKTSTVDGHVDVSGVERDTTLKLPAAMLANNFNERENSFQRVRPQRHLNLFYASSTL
jgi:hypothetical protein